MQAPRPKRRVEKLKAVLKRLALVQSLGAISYLPSLDDLLWHKCTLFSLKVSYCQEEAFNEVGTCSFERTWCCKCHQGVKVPQGRHSLRLRQAAVTSRRPWRWLWLGPGVYIRIRLGKLQTQPLGSKPYVNCSLYHPHTVVYSLHGPEQYRDYRRLQKSCHRTPRSAKPYLP